MLVLRSVLMLGNTDNVHIVSVLVADEEEGGLPLDRRPSTPSFSLVTLPLLQNPEALMVT